MAPFDNNKLGELRPNQIITTFGPGAIVDAVKDSVTVLDGSKQPVRLRQLHKWVSPWSQNDYGCASDSFSSQVSSKTQKF